MFECDINRLDEKIKCYSKFGDTGRGGITRLCLTPEDVLGRNEFIKRTKELGATIKIDDMARNLIRLSGYEPDVDIPIVYTGLRPGEKMYEECLRKEEGLEKTANDLIFVGKPIEFDEEAFFVSLKELKKLAYEDGNGIRKAVKEIVPSYQSKEAEK